VNWYLAPVIVTESSFTGQNASQVASHGVEHFPLSSMAHIGRATDVPVPTLCLIKTATPADDWVRIPQDDFDAQFLTLFGRLPLDNEK
jgi:hypothetical protein